MPTIFLNRNGFLNDPEVVFHILDNTRGMYFCIWDSRGCGNYDLVPHTQMLKLKEKVHRLR